MRIIAPKIDYDSQPPPLPQFNPAICEKTGGAHCPCYRNEPDPVVVVPWRCCACMQQAVLCMRPVV
jgi:hypothetical protein